LKNLIGGPTETFVANVIKNFTAVNDASSEISCGVHCMHVCSVLAYVVAYILLPSSFIQNPREDYGSKALDLYLMLGEW
jgi:hypothetical protein